MCHFLNLVSPTYDRETAQCTGNKQRFGKWAANWVVYSGKDELDRC